MNHEEEGAQRRISLPRKETSNFPLPISPEKKQEKQENDHIRGGYVEGDKEKPKNNLNYSFCGVLGTKKSRSGSQES